MTGQGKSRGTSSHPGDCEVLRRMLISIVFLGVICAESNDVVVTVCLQINLLCPDLAVSGSVIFDEIRENDFVVLQAGRLS